MTTDEEILYPSSDGDYYCGDSEETPDEQEPLSPAPIGISIEPVISITPCNGAYKMMDSRQARLNEEYQEKK